MHAAYPMERIPGCFAMMSEPHPTSDVKLEAAIAAPVWYRTFETDRSSKNRNMIKIPAFIPYPMTIGTMMMLK